MSFTEDLRRAIDYVLCHLHTSLPGEVVSYNEKTGLASIKPLIKRQYADGQQISMPILTNVPVRMLRTQAATITVKLAKGDTGMIVFSERAIGAWIQLGGEQPPDAPRKHDLTDATFYPGVWPGDSGKLGGTHDVDIVAHGASIVLDGGVITSTDAGGATVVMDSGKITCTDADGATVQLATGVITASTPAGAEVVLSANTVTATDGVGDTLSLAGGTATLSDASGNSIEWGSTPGIKISSGGGEVRAHGGKVALGASGIELLDQLATALTDIANCTTTGDHQNLSCQSALLTIAANISSIAGSL